MRKASYNNDIFFKTKEETTLSNNPPNDPYVSVSPCCRLLTASWLIATAGL